MASVKLHYDGWLKLPAGMLRALGAKTGDTLEVTPGDGGLVLRAGGGKAGTDKRQGPLADPMPAESAAVETPPSTGRAARREELPSGEARTSVALPPALRGRAGGRKARAATQGGEGSDVAAAPSGADRRADPA